MSDKDSIVVLSGDGMFTRKELREALKTANKKIEGLECSLRISGCGLDALDIVKADFKELLLLQRCPDEREEDEYGYSQGEALFWHKTANNAIAERDKLEAELAAIKKAEGDS